MNPIERASIAVRHLPALERADWLWKRVRPAYDRMLSTLAGRRGLERVINGSDSFRLSPLSRGFVAEEYEPEVWNRVMREIGSGDRVVEVGASFGLYTLAFARRIGSGGHVTAFEPDPQSAAALEANIRVNGWQDRVTVVSAAVGAENGKVRFAAARGMESHIATAGDSSRGAILVPLVTLDSVVADRRIDVLKIDVEGFEEQVLQGARTILTTANRRPRAILVEVHPFAWSETGTTSSSLLALLRESGFRVENMTGDEVREIGEYGHVIALRQ
ncbi:MAG TPA: FkbM family methyltransferase [Candidatus Acidoferrales bacterium]|nr:FkbM family methyltransferase [Candidatus Acidoferrales bacterium]